MNSRTTEQWNSGANSRSQGSRATDNRAADNLTANRATQQHNTTAWEEHNQTVQDTTTLAAQQSGNGEQRWRQGRKPETTTKGVIRNRWSTNTQYSNLATHKNPGKAQQHSNQTRNNGDNSHNNAGNQQLEREQQNSQNQLEQWSKQ
jgi:hypothetical protein